MDSFQSKDGHLFIRGLAQYIRQHEKALANSLRLSVQHRQPAYSAGTSNNATASSIKSTSASTLAAALSFAGLNFKSHSTRSKTLDLTAHHLFFLLSRFEELEINTGPMNVRIESIHHHPSPTNYVSFLQTGQPPPGRGDADSIHSVSSVRSAMSGMSAFWSSVGLGLGSSKNEKAKLSYETDLKYIYRSCTVLPSLKLTPNHRLPLVRGYEEFPFDTAVPLFVFKNLQQLEIIDVDFRQFHGWDRLAEQLCLLTVKRANVEDPIDLLINIVLDDAEKRRRRSTRGAHDAPSTPSWSIPSTPKASYAQSSSDPGSPAQETPSSSPLAKSQMHEDNSVLLKNKASQQITSESVSPKRPSPARPTSSYRYVRSYSSRVRRSGSGSSNSTDYSAIPHRSESASNINMMNVLQQSKWQRLVYLSLADNALTSLSAKSLAPLAASLKYFNLSSNLFTEIPDSLSTLSRLVSLDLSHCMIASLQSLTRYPLPAITTIKLKGNRLQSLSGIERLLSLENLDISENKLTDPMEAARLTVAPHLHRLNVKKNPFTKSFPDYRLRIMNLFRKTPGYLEDLVIDEQPASSSEKRQLVERVPEDENPATLYTRKSSEYPVILQQRKDHKGSEEEAMPQKPSSYHHDLASSSGKRRKGPKRRIVDLARDDESWMHPKVHDAQPGRNVVIDNHPAVGLGLKHSDVLSSDTGLFTAGLGGVATYTEPTIEIHSEEYRAKIENLRQQFGSNWLGALEEPSYHADHQVVSGGNQTKPKLHVATPVVTSGPRSLGSTLLI